jgi:hypothetical protein
MAIAAKKRREALKRISNNYEGALILALIFCPFLESSVPVSSSSVTVSIQQL